MFYRFLIKIKSKTTDNPNNSCVNFLSYEVLPHSFISKLGRTTVFVKIEEMITIM